MIDRVDCGDHLGVLIVPGRMRVRTMAVGAMRTGGVDRGAPVWVETHVRARRVDDMGSGVVDLTAVLVLERHVDLTHLLHRLVRRHVHGKTLQGKLAGFNDIAKPFGMKHGIFSRYEAQKRNRSTLISFDRVQISFPAS